MTSYPRGAVAFFQDSKFINLIQQQYPPSLSKIGYKCEHDSWTTVALVMTVLADSWLRCDSVSDSRDSTESEKNAAPDDDPPRDVASPAAADAAAAITVAGAVWLAGEAVWFVGGAWQTAACWLCKARHVFRLVNWLKFLIR